MRVEKGATRVVIIAGQIAIKFPRIYFLTIIESLIYYLQGKRKFWMYFLKWELKELLFKGIICNFREFLFYNNTKLPLLAPTHFSFFGLINFQKAVIPYPPDLADVPLQILELTNKEAWKDDHGFLERENYGVLNGKLSMVDYGSREVQKVLRTYGNAIYENFIFRRAKAKK